ncbi:hypothetical protein, partial [Corynebacterium stationis]|uniref:hypothetical protein n=1 Tax=Corynebacterium stationis TaxID=1705 RepID=UPI00263A7033
CAVISTPPTANVPTSCGFSVMTENEFSTTRVRSSHNAPSAWIILSIPTINTWQVLSAQTV